MDKNKKVLLISVISLGIILIGVVSYLIYLNYKSKSADKQQTVETPTITATLTTTPTASKTITPTPVKTSTPTVTPTPEPTKSTDELVGNALYQKFSKDSSSLTFSISKKSDNAAYGSMTFTDTSEGGYFVAAKDSDGNWKVIADGNGTIECSILDQYNVPASVVGQCYDSSSEESKTR